MSYKVEKLDNSQVKFSFDIDAPTFEKAIDEAYQKTKHKFSIAGFRKGRVPKKVIEGIYGKEVFFEDAMDIVIPNAYTDALQNEPDIDVVAQPELSGFDFKENGGAEFSLVVTVKPDVKLGEYKGLGIEKKVEKITAKNVDEAIEETRAKQARIIDSESNAKNGDIVTIDFAGSVDGEVFEGGSAEGYDLELGSNSFIPGFEEQLVGVMVEDIRDVKVTFPAEYHAAELQNKEAIFTCTVKSVKSKELPALDDEFVKEISEFDTLVEYKKSVKENLKADAEKKAEGAFEDALVEAIANNAEVEIPQAMIDSEADDMVREFEHRLMYQGLKMDDYLGYINMTKEQLSEEYKEQAKKSVKVRLVMEAIVKAEDVQFEDKDIDVKLEEIASNAGQSLEEFRKTLKREQIDYIVNQILSEKIMSVLKENNAQVSAPAKKAPAKKAAAKKAE